MAMLDTFPGSADLRDPALVNPGLPPGTVTPVPNGPGPGLLTASTITGDKILNLQEQTLGTIEEIMLDMSSGRIAYVVMASGGFLGLGEKLFALPWSALTLDADRKCFVLDASKEKFDHAPGFDKDSWPSEADREWHVQVHRYYSRPPYWE
ncbi:PRC-barrel domain-containing protein [Ideonella azotifigens]|uniref:PRC-barrel domain-containing protein n=1 Tax=Ideonella azotifigens TaxID=513160 RepID=A0ABP3VYB3_9BURK|nr:PRC-barrel domain-containing protein [Ideonella azotifigens]MCD2339336.1 PRC-barrel domain-containing protein [Ideonella azotifigens]